MFPCSNRSQPRSDLDTRPNDTKCIFVKTMVILTLCANLFYYSQLGVEFHKANILPSDSTLSLARPDNSSTPAPGDAASTNNYRQTKFDLVAESAFREATAPENPPQPRKPFDMVDLKWSRGTGGLNDADRKFIGELYYEANSVFEFGMGESTKIAAAVGVPRYAGTDSDPNWVGMAREQSGNPNFRFYFADIGETIIWGNPKQPDLPKIKFDYQVSALMAEQEAFDVYMVDGRYRVACACVSFLHAIKHGADLEKVRVLIHDSLEKAREYDVFREVADPEMRENSALWSYKLKHDRPNIEEEVYDLWERLKNDQKR